jgi:hypothetical protein
VRDDEALCDDDDADRIPHTQRWYLPTHQPPPATRKERERDDISTYTSHDHNTPSL